MRVLALTNLYPSPLYPHRAAFNRRQLSAVAAAGHDVRVVAPIAWTDELSARRQGKAALPKGRKVVCDGIPVEHPRYWFTPKVLRGSYGKFFCRSVAGAFRRAVAEFRPDVVFASWAYPDGWAAAELAREAGLPMVLKVHGSDVLLTHAARPGLLGESVRRADGVIAVSRDLADRVIRLGVDPKRVRVIYSGVDPDVFYPGDRDSARAKLGLPPHVPAVLFVGNLVHVKGIDVLLGACRRLTGDGVRFVCHLVGQGALRAQLERQIADYGLGGRVTLVGAVRQEGLADWYRAADVFVLPSRSEGVPNVLLEASACGTRFVASRVGGIPEVAHLGRGELVPAEDDAALAAALGRALREAADETTGAVRVARGKPRTHADAASEIVGLFEEVLAAGARAAPDPTGSTAGREDVGCASAHELSAGSKETVC